MDLETRIWIFYGGLFAVSALFFYLVLRWQYFYLCAVRLPIPPADRKRHYLLPVLLQNLRFPVLAESLHNESYCNHYPDFYVTHTDWLPEERMECADGEWNLVTAWDNGDKSWIGGTYTAVLRRRILPRFFRGKTKPVPNLNIGETTDMWLSGHMVNGRCYMMQSGWLRALITPGAPKIAPLYCVEMIETLSGIANGWRREQGLPCDETSDWAPALMPVAVVWGFIKAIVCWPRFVFAPRVGWYPFTVHLEIERRRFS